MAYENIEIQHDNFCVAPLVGTFATVDTNNADAYLRIKNDTGGTAGTYTFNPNISQGTTIYGLEYVGPRSTSVTRNGMVFFTLESNTTSTCTIKKWNLNVDNSRLDLDYTFTKSSDSLDKYVCKAGTVGKYFTSLTETTVTGTGQLKLDNVDTIVPGTRLFLGPGTNGAYMNDFEEVEVTSVSGTTVQITSALGIPPFSYYNSGDIVTYVGNIYLVSSTGASGATDKGTLFSLNSATGNVIDRHYSGLYNSIKAVGYTLPYYNTIGIVKTTELLYVSIEDFEVKKSNRLNNTLVDNVSYIQVKDIEFKTSSIYRLQDQTTRRDDNGDLAQVNWVTYNFQEDSVFRFTDTLALYTDPIGIIANQEAIDIYVVVRDQYGVGISGKVVTFDKIAGDSNGTWGDVNRQATTDINGIGVITYTSGWYDHNIITPAEEDIKIEAHTDGSNILTGSIYVWAELTMLLKAKFMVSPDTSPYGVPLIVQKVDELSSVNTFEQISALSSTLNIVARACFMMPGGNTSCPGGVGGSVSLIRQRRSFNSEALCSQKELLTSTSLLEQLKLVSDTVPVSQTYISRHHTNGNQDTVEIAQFRFMIDLVPAPFSEKNTVNTNIWVKMAPYGFDLDQSTLVFKIREMSYAGDTGYVDYVGTSYLTITEFDAGGGLIGLEVLFDPPWYFHNNALVYVYIEVYDNATPVNRIEFDYWFLVIADYNAPYVTNELPERNATDVSTDTDISFDVIDNEVGVEVNTLELYINNRAKNYAYTTISGGYHIECNNLNEFYYEQSVEVAIRVEDSSGQHNVLYDMWRFECESSLEPFVDPESFIPKACVYGVNQRTTEISFNVFDGGDGVDEDSIQLMVGGILRSVRTTPIIKRIK